MGYIHVCNGINSVYGIATHKNKKHNSVAYTESNYKFGDEFLHTKGIIIRISISEIMEW